MLYYMTKGTKIVDGIRVVNQLILNREVILDYPDEPTVIAKVPESGRGRRTKSQCQGNGT